MSTQSNLSIISKNLNEAVGSVINQKSLIGFERAYQISTAIVKLKQLLTPEYMTPIMAMQGNRLGFKTDKDKTGGYPVETVKNCLIEAVMLGVQPYGNHFNIIAGNTYLTKEGCGFLLDTYEGLKYSLICGLPVIGREKTSAAVDVTITWTLNGVKSREIVPIPLKMDAYTSVDALIGKATRKGRAWLLSNLTGIEIPEGDVKDAIIIDAKEPLRERASNGTQVKVDLP